MSSPKPSIDDLRIERPAEKPGRSWLPGIVVLIVLAGVAVWWFMRPKPTPVQTAVAREIVSNGEKADRTVLNASGYVTARRAATVSSKVTGKVTEVLIEEGMKVQEGQVLARLDDTNVKASLAVAEAQLESTRTAVSETEAQLKQSEQEFRRTTELARQNIASAADLDRAEADAKMLRARLDRLQRDVTVADRQVALWKQQLDDTIIRAPFSGVITTKDAQPGEMISPVSAGGGFTRTGIGTVVDMQSLEIEIDVNESYINRVTAGQPVEATLDAYSDWSIPCKVVAIIPTADRQKSTVKVRVGFDKLDPRILPEMAVKVAFRETAHNGGTSDRRVAIPKAAIQSRDGMDVVFVAAKGRVERRAISMGSAQGDEAVVTAGVSAGEKVVVNAGSDLADGTRIKEIK